MADVLRRKLRLVGALQGKSVTLNGYRFVKGDLLLETTVPEFECIFTYFRNGYQAIEVGPDEAPRDPLPPPEEVIDGKREVPSGQPNG